MDDPTVNEVFGSLADPKRIAIIGELKFHPMGAGELATALKLTPAALSRHLRILRRAGVVEATTGDEDARTRVYRLCPRALFTMRSWIGEIEAHWEDQLQAFKNF